MVCLVDYIGDISVKTMKLSKHSKRRMRERTAFNSDERRKLFRDALDKGKSIQEIDNKKLKHYIWSKSRYCKIKVYRGYMFLYSKNSHQLYTMYEIPKRFKGEEL